MSIQNTDYSAYLLVHFIGEQPEGEQIYFSLSKDGLRWKDLNGGLPVLRSTLGERGVRDPFLVRSPQENKFYLIATDLRIEAGKGWVAAANEGSRDIIVWESPDLTSWSEPWSVTVGVPGAGCVWAPEAIYDEQSDNFLVYWASNTKNNGEKERRQRIFCARTKDFRSFSETELYIEKDNHIIDTTIIAHQGAYYRISAYNNIALEKGCSLDKDSFVSLSSPVLENYKGVEGPQIFKLNDRDEWCLLVDRFAEGKGYLPLLTSDLDSGDFCVVPENLFNLGVNKKRHGGVIPITYEESKLLLKVYGDEQ